MAKCEKILICGFSGAGKTSLIRELEFTAPDSKWTFSDLDQLVLKSHREKEVAQIIATHGWDKFRLWERQELEGWLKEEGPGVLSLGGGTLSQLLLDLYQPIKKIKLCHVHAPFQDCWERLHLENTEPRPLVKLGKGELHRIYEDRQKIFDQIPWKIENPLGSDLSRLSQQFWETVASS
jgi:shikimate kinase